MSDLVFGLAIFRDLEQPHLPVLTELITPVFFEQNEMVILCGEGITDINIMSSGLATLFNSKGDFVLEAERAAAFGHEALAADDKGATYWPYSLVAKEFSEFLTIAIQELAVAFEGDPMFAKMKERAARVPNVVADDAESSRIPASQKLSDDDRLRLRAAFELADGDGSGHIDMVEFFTLIRKIMEVGRVHLEDAPLIILALFINRNRY